MMNSEDWRAARGHSQQGSIDVRLGKVPQRIFLVKYKETGTSARVPVAPNEWSGSIHQGGAQRFRRSRWRERPREGAGNKIGSPGHLQCKGGAAEENSDVVSAS